MVAVFVAWMPALPGDWASDDETYLTNNPLLHDPAHLWKIWFEPGSFIEYYPITETVQLGQWQLWHQDPSGYVWTNILLHLVNAFLVWRLLQQFGLRWAWLGGLLFAIHPQTVESVAWISELKNTLSLAPALLAMSAWIQYEETKQGRDYIIALGLFLLSMLCKITMAPFAVVIFLYAWWKRGRIGWGDFKASLPFFFIAFVLGMTTHLAGGWFAQHYGQSAPRIPLDGLLSRLTLVGTTGAFYLAKFFWPWTPAPAYPHWNINPSALWQFLPWLVLGGALYGCWTQRRSWGRHVLLGTGYFFIMLAPFLGFIGISYMQFTWVMDHLVYFPMIGLIGLVVAGMEHAHGQLPPRFRPLSIAGLGFLMLGLTLETRAYAGIFSRQETLYIYALRVNPDSYLAHASLGHALMKKGDLAGAIRQFQEAQAIDPDNSEAHFSLGTLLMEANHWEEAKNEFAETIRIAPTHADAHDNLGVILLQLGRPAEAIAQFHQALQILDFAQAHNDLGNALFQTGQIEEAIAEYRKAVKLNPDAAQVRDNLALALCQGKHFPEAIEQFQAALTVNPQDDTARAALEKLRGLPASPSGTETGR